MEAHTKWYIGAIVSGLLAIATSPTIIGAFVFGLIAIGAVINGYEAEHGERPWWTKNFAALWRDRGDADRE